ncbi:FkbM family methyltransferase [Thermodesulfobacteriota bacterium]
MKKIIINNTPQFIRKVFRYLKFNIFDGYARKSYSQEGEDMILNRIFENKTDGFYVDVGAHHPKRFSNTYFFYKKGWKGINIDAMPGSMKLFKKLRPRDINLEIPISNKNEYLTYYMFNEPALNGFSEKLSEERDGKNQYKIISKTKMKTATLENVLDEHLLQDQQIDFMSIDVEGLDLQVLESNNWKKHRPQFVLVEFLNKPGFQIDKFEKMKLLNSVGYSFYAKSICTVFYKKNDILNIS